MRDVSHLEGANRREAQKGILGRTGELHFNTKDEAGISVARISVRKVCFMSRHRSSRPLGRIVAEYALGWKPCSLRLT